jgi:hypothetical protein
MHQFATNALSLVFRVNKDFRNRCEKVAVRQNPDDANQARAIPRPDVRRTSQCYYGCRRVVRARPDPHCKHQERVGAEPLVRVIDVGHAAIVIGFVYLTGRLCGTARPLRLRRIAHQASRPGTSPLRL